MNFVQKHDQVCHEVEVKKFFLLILFVFSVFIFLFLLHCTSPLPLLPLPSYLVRIDGTREDIMTTEAQGRRESRPNTASCPD
jgi:hypothetical protein